jgi:predicted ArsR family transcriptional regulator
VTDFEQSVSGIGALAEPVRRELYRYVCAQPDPVSRDQAAEAVGVARHAAKFHLDKLESEGLLQTGYARVTGRTGPGAGRTSKLYRRAAGDIAVSLPPREYQLAGMVMADAIVETERTGRPIRETLNQAAKARGTAIAQAAHRAATGGDVLDATAQVLAENGYEPRYDGHRLTLANCPFHALAVTHTNLVCHMNLALITALADNLAPTRVRAALDPGPGRCCVTLEAAGEVLEPTDQ